MTSVPPVSGSSPILPQKVVITIKDKTCEITLPSGTKREVEYIYDQFAERLRPQDKRFKEELEKILADPKKQKLSENRDIVHGKENVSIHFKEKTSRVTASTAKTIASKKEAATAPTGVASKESAAAKTLPPRGRAKTVIAKEEAAKKSVNVQYNESTNKFEITLPNGTKRVIATAEDKGVIKEKYEGKPIKKGTFDAKIYESLLQRGLGSAKAQQEAQKSDSVSSGTITVVFEKLTSASSPPRRHPAPPLPPRHPQPKQASIPTPSTTPSPSPTPSRTPSGSTESQEEHTTTSRTPSPRRLKPSEVQVKKESAAQVETLLLPAVSEDIKKKLKEAISALPNKELAKDVIDAIEKARENPDFNKRWINSERKDEELSDLHEKAYSSLLPPLVKSFKTEREYKADLEKALKAAPTRFPRVTPSTTKEIWEDLYYNVWKSISRLEPEEAPQIGFMLNSIRREDFINKSEKEFLGVLNNPKTSFEQAPEYEIRDYVGKLYEIASKMLVRALITKDGAFIKEARSTMTAIEGACKADVNPVFKKCWDQIQKEHPEFSSLLKDLKKA